MKNYFILILLGILFLIPSCQKEDKKIKNILFGLFLLSRNSPSQNTCMASSTSPSVETVNSTTKLTVKPSTTSSCINSFDEAHQIYPPTITSKNILSVFLPGTGASPDEYALILQRGATRGYHVIGLTYPNPDAVNTICNSNGNPSLTCHGEVREEILTGENKSNLVSIDFSNSIEGRLISLLNYLISQRPAEGWDRFISNNQLVFTKIYMGGHSQGSGHAAYEGKIKPIARVSMYSGSSDYVSARTSFPSWMSLPQISTQTSYFGFIGVNDTIANYSGNSNQVTDSWTTLGLTSAVTDVTIGSPYSNSKRLITNSCLAMSQILRHSCPMFNGFQNVWDYISYP